MALLSVPGWEPIERIDSVVVTRVGGLHLRLAHWESPSGDVTLIAVNRYPRSQEDGFVPVVSAIGLGELVGLSPGESVLDPRIHWCTEGSRRIVVCPALGVRVAVSSRMAVALPNAHRRVSPTIVSILSDRGGHTDTSGDEVVTSWHELLGRHAGVVTNWPVRGMANGRLAIAGEAPPNLSAGPVPMCRGDSESAGGGVASIASH